MTFTNEIRADVSGRSARASLVVEPNSDYLDDHFPGDPMLPGLVMLEAAVRAAAALWPRPGHDGTGQPTLDRVDRLHVMRRVIPGETLIVTAEMVDPLGDQATRTFDARGLVDGEPAMRARFRLRSFDSERSGR